jgi:hypothetical protein
MQMESGYETANRPVHEPAKVSGKLLGLRAGEQHANAHFGMAAHTRANPARRYVGEADIPAPGRAVNTLADSATC